MIKDKAYYLAGITAFVIWGFFPMALRQLTAFTAGEILFFRIFISFGLVLLIIPIFRWKSMITAWETIKMQPAKDRRITIGLTLLGSVFLAGNWLIFIYTVNSINLKTASFSYLICPVITSILGVIFLQERLSRIKWLAVGLCAMSCILIGSASIQELNYSLLTATSYALYLVSQRRNQGYDRMILLGIQLAFICVILAIFNGMLLKEQWPAGIHFYGYIIFIAAIFTIIPLFLNLFALNRVDSSTIGILMYLNPLINFFIALTIFKEEVTTLQILGYTIILIGLILFNLSFIKKLFLGTAIRDTSL